MSNTLLICDNPDEYCDRYDLVTYWESFDEENGAYSLPKMVEINSKYLRGVYLDWLYKIGRVNIDGRSIIDHLLIRDGFSYWWMTLLVEKSQWKSPSLYKAFRLMALCILIEQQKIKKIDIKVSNKIVSKSIKQWCIENRVKYRVILVKEFHTPITIRRVINLAPYFMQAGVALLQYLIEHRPLKHTNKKKYPDSNGKVTFFSYFFNLDRDSAIKGSFYTHYWTSLHNLITSSSNYSTNWIHIFIKNDLTPTSKDALNLVNQFNLDLKSNQSHTLLESGIGWGVIGRTIIDYLKIAYFGWKVRGIRHHFKVSSTSINLWSVMRHDWKSSLFGKVSVMNCFFLNLFENSLQQLPKQKKGFYLLENQAWERSLIYAWRHAGHGQIIGVQHAAVSYWDLRHFFSPLEYSNNHNMKLPMPDKVALNGDAAIKMYTEGGFPVDNIVHVEALRYLYLDRLDIDFPINSTSATLRLLVLGDYIAKRTNKQLRLLAEALEKLPDNLVIIVKSHPATPINPLDWPELNIIITNDSLDQLAGQYDVAYTSNSTAAALDAYLSGIRVLIMLDPETFNMNPLRELPEVEYISSHNDLVRALSVKQKKYHYESDFFFTENSIPRWKKLLME